MSGGGVVTLILLAFLGVDGTRSGHGDEQNGGKRIRIEETSIACSCTWSELELRN
jgi:hypothetical protein